MIPLLIGPCQSLFPYLPLVRDVVNPELTPGSVMATNHNVKRLGETDTGSGEPGPSTG